MINQYTPQSVTILAIYALHKIKNKWDWFGDWKQQRNKSKLRYVPVLNNGEDMNKVVLLW
jgi:hypothetical protein